MIVALVLAAVIAAVVVVAVTVRDSGFRNPEPPIVQLFGDIEISGASPYWQTLITDDSSVLTEEMLAEAKDSFFTGYRQEFFGVPVIFDEHVPEGQAYLLGLDALHHDPFPIESEPGPTIDQYLAEKLQWEFQRRLVAEFKDIEP